MTLTAKVGIPVCLLSLCFSVAVSAQSGERVSFGAAVTSAHLPQVSTDDPEGMYPYVVTPYGSSRGWEVSAGFAVSRRVSIDGELSLAPPATVSTTESHPSSYAARTMAHRDTIAVALVRFRLSKYFDVVCGGGTVSARTSVTLSGYSGRLRYDGMVYESPSNGRRGALALGANLVLPLHKHFSVLGLVRLYHLSRDEPLHSYPFSSEFDSRPFLQPSANVFRLGVGLRVGL